MKHLTLSLLLVACDAAPTPATFTLTHECLSGCNDGWERDAPNVLDRDDAAARLWQCDGDVKTDAPSYVWPDFDPSSDFAWVNWKGAEIVTHATPGEASCGFWLVIPVTEGGAE